MDPTLKDVFDRLYSHYGPRHWWPADSAFEVLVGAVLVQNTAWENVRKAIDRLRGEDLLEPHALYAVPLERAGGADPAGRLLPRQGPAAPQSAGVPGRAL